MTKEDLQTISVDIENKTLTITGRAGLPGGIESVTFKIGEIVDVQRRPKQRWDQPPASPGWEDSWP